MENRKLKLNQGWVIKQEYDALKSEVEDLRKDKYDLMRELDRISDMVELKHNDKTIADSIKRGIDALSMLAQMRLDFIETNGLLSEYFKYMKSRMERS